MKQSTIKELKPGEHFQILIEGQGGQGEIESQGITYSRGKYNRVLKHYFCSQIKKPIRRALPGKTRVFIIDQD